MSKAIKLVIGGKDYTLRGDDEKVIRLAASEVNSQIEDLKARHLEESQATLNVLAALNIAENYYRTTRGKEIERRFIVSELDDMADFLAARLRKDLF